MPEELGIIESIEQAVMQISWLGQRQCMQLLDSEQFRLTLPQFYTLLYLHEAADKCKMSAVADATHQSAASLTGVVDRLLEKQLVMRTRDERDRRQVVVVVTPRGSTLISAIKQARHAQMQATLQGLPPEDTSQLLELLHRVINGMRHMLGHEEHRAWNTIKK
ncbi:MAG: MarR family transcriptional regulator [Blastochloris sp.]|nr:MarR family transcriptional regulator [Blastochloris sp.]